MLLAHKIALDPNAAQRTYFARAAGTAIGQHGRLRLRELFV